MGYYSNLQNIGIEAYRDKLKTADLLPSRTVLKNDIDKHFEKTKNSGVANLEELLEKVKDKKKIEAFANQSGIDGNYLTILAREIKSYRQPPSKLRDFPEIPPKVISDLEKTGISNTVQLYDKVLTKENRNKLSKETGVSQEWIEKLARLTNLCRIRWVNHTFAFILFETGYVSAQSVAEANVAEVHEKVNQFIEEKGLFKVRIGQHDIKLCLEAAKDLSFDMIF